MGATRSAFWAKVMVLFRGDDTVTVPHIFSRLRPAFLVALLCAAKDYLFIATEKLPLSIVGTETAIERHIYRACGAHNPKYFYLFPGTRIAKNNYGWVAIEGADSKRRLPRWKIEAHGNCARGNSRMTDSKGNPIKNEAEKTGDLPSLCEEVLETRA